MLSRCFSVCRLVSTNCYVTVALRYSCRLCLVVPVHLSVANPASDLDLVAMNVSILFHHYYTTDVRVVIFAYFQT